MDGSGKTTGVDSPGYEIQGEFVKLTRDMDLDGKAEALHLGLEALHPFGKAGASTKTGA
jgi:hypothetical protein